MSPTNKIKWIVGIILAGLLLLLGLTGGTWGTDFTANAGANANPIIYAVFPPEVPARHPDRVVIIWGTNFGNEINTGVRLVGNGFDGILHPISVEQSGLSVTISGTLMTEATVYTLTVVRSDFPSVPTIPIEPIWDRESNPIQFTVFQAIQTYLPVINIKP